MYASSSADKYGTGRTATAKSYHHHHLHHLHHHHVGTSSSSSSSSSSYALSSELSADRRSRAYSSAPRQVTPVRSTASSRLTDINGNIRSLSLSKSLSPASSLGSARGEIGGKTTLLQLGNDNKRYDATKKRLDAFYNSRSPSSLLNKSYNYKSGNLSYFEKYNKQQYQQDSPPPNEPLQQSKYVNMNRTNYGGITDNGAVHPESSSSSSAYRSVADSKKGVVGIRNIGNTCYMNSVLQCLSNTKRLTDSVLDDVDGADGKLIRVYRDLLSRIWTAADSHPVDTTAFKSAFQRLSPRFAGYEQQDAQEFLRLLLDRLHMDVNRVKVKPRAMPDVDETLKDNALAIEFWQRYLATDNSTVVDLFAGQLKSTLECSTCGHKSITFEVFWDVSLPLPSSGSANIVSINDLLHNFTQEEVLDFRERPRCSVCKVDRKMFKSYRFQRLPRYLVLHLKRFQGTQSYKKITSLVAFPSVSLDMSPYVSGTARSIQPQGCKYNLYAVSNHTGTPIAGHYTAMCKHPVTGDWNFFNDSSVSRITSSAKLISNEAYILFYEAANY
ncbi:ubiquitin carboxyl-terminal hydrolase 2 [Rhopalosiphum padi]|uniref:ubiquitin carboxyl-terminal hydrolase 2 n=1 Tax=Rhopalosiphum padi TaxID=40932 RepID=UPI00298DFACF|nr:ubiquitin carboxyl-terminal hydrolase 2 [Rhopalosiphum padi]XP_060850618.1 ubiquitin carboxyl-terminal hydrolase 2 [Rhopalosiphum padi]XP_060850619.1 ubiquitin carboxyl-terminal hydrolase 2 [Rhopalosiphum padi]